MAVRLTVILCLSGWLSKRLFSGDTSQTIQVSMRFLIKLLISVCIIVFCAQIGRKLPSLAGLVAVMPLTGLVVLIWLCLDNLGNFNLITDYCKGAL